MEHPQGYSHIVGCGTGPMKQRQRVLARAKEIELIARRLSKELRSGQTRSSLRGQGMRFAEHRVYQYGDEHRHIDWRASARSREPLIKIFEEDREFSTIILIDMSASMAFGTSDDTNTKLSVGLELAAILSLATIFGGGAASAVALANDSFIHVPRLKSIHQVFATFGQWERVGGIGKANPLIAAPLIKRSKANLIFLLSDFLDWEFASLQQLGRARQQFTPLRILDESEKRLDFAPSFLPLHLLETEKTTEWSHSSEAATASPPAWVPDAKRVLGLDPLTYSRLRTALNL